MHEHLSFVSATSWPEVWGRWKGREKGIWEDHFEERGFATWEAWREQYVGPFRLRNRFWQVVEIDDPNAFIPQVWAGGYRGWRGYFGDRKEIRFEDLAENLEVRKNPKVQAVFDDFPQDTEIILFQHKDEFVLFEGMHRGCAIALAAAEGRRIHGIVRASVTIFGEDEANLFTKAKQRINK